MRIQTKTEKKIAGFCEEEIKPGSKGKVLCKGFVNSDEPLFYKYIDQLSTIFLSDLLLNNIYQFLVIIKDNGDVDVILNDALMIEEAIMPKRRVKAKEVIRRNDIVDIRAVRFKDVQIENTDQIAFCFKIGWKFGLYFDFIVTKDEEWTVDTLYEELGRYFRYMTFQNLYELINTNEVYKSVFEDNEWFPFIQIIHDIEANTERLKDEKQRDIIFNEIENSFDKQRIDSIVTNWWNSHIFQKCKQGIMHGVEEFTNFNDAGYYKCIKLLIPAIDGILHHLCSEKNSDVKRMEQKLLLDTVHDEAVKKFIFKDSLTFPTMFKEYLTNILYRGFRMSSETIQFSRNSVCHDVLPEEGYTKTRALISILILDQIFFYISAGGSVPQKNSISKIS